jgi:hypothetical protein
MQADGRFLLLAPNVFLIPTGMVTQALAVVVAIAEALVMVVGLMANTSLALLTRVRSASSLGFLMILLSKQRE